MRIVTLVCLLVIAVAGAATAVSLGAANPTGQWATPKMVKTALVGKPLAVMECTGSCGFVNGGPFGDWTTDLKVNVVSTTVLGLGKYRLFNGGRRYQLFNVTACAVDYLQGGERVGVHMRWYTKRPPSSSTTTNGGIVSSSSDGGAAYGADWDHPDVIPVANPGC